MNTSTTSARATLPIDEIVDPRWAAWQPFIETSVHLQTLLDDELRTTSGMSLADYHVMLLLAKAPAHRLRMNELSRSMVFSSSRLSYQIDSLGKKGWVTREAVPTDRRGSYAVLSPSGLRALADAGKVHLRSVKRLFVDVLDVDDGQALATALRRIASALEES
ncbi:putative MarR family transcriptional regulator [Gordonia effusa NBRC 100432]|uniref:Putative MarR family transcriptional regulator n=1 Tax=Gordonia effusa NBRC 100432 TaxID=1077974 RepID=H0R5S4_9ACTN|nr:MarR family transcriptional regulator [Gordonia effusa]GAB20425.1 putative MarR family transcriptional regulator [Gordonia effusa NBRC 100432]